MEPSVAKFNVSNTYLVYSLPVAAAPHVEHLNKADVGFTEKKIDLSLGLGCPVQNKT